MIEYCEWCNEMINLNTNTNYLTLVDRKETWLVKNRHTKQINLGFYREYFCDEDCFTNTRPDISLPNW